MAPFVQKQIEQLFSSYIWLCIFWRKNIGAKCARKMLMKLTPEKKKKASVAKLNKTKDF